MITTKNAFSGANFDYNSENNCTASGEFRYEGENLVSISINGNLAKDDVVYPFWANRDASGNVNISGVPTSVIQDVAAEVATIIAEIESVNEE